MYQMAKILCLEDSEEFQVYIASILREHYIIHANKLSEALEILKTTGRDIDLIILDINLPDGNSLNVMPEIKNLLQGRMVPIIILSSDDHTLTKVAAFGIGADEYISKPTNSSELKARIDAKLRWVASFNDKKSVIVFADLLIDIDKILVFIQKGPTEQVAIDLTPIEFKILKHLASRPEQVFSREQLIDAVWGDGHNITPRTIDAHISHIRNKTLASQVIIETVLSAGYKITQKSQTTR